MNTYFYTYNRQTHTLLRVTFAVKVEDGKSSEWKEQPFILCFTELLQLQWWHKPSNWNLVACAPRLNFKCTFFRKGGLCFYGHPEKDMRSLKPPQPSLFLYKTWLLGCCLNDIANQLAIHSKTEILYIFSSVYNLVPIFLTLPRSKVWTCNYCETPCPVWQEKDGQATVVPLWLRHLGISSGINSNCRLI